MPPMAPRRPPHPLVDPGLRAILADLKAQILSGRLSAGTRLPALRDLAASYGVAATTVHRCLRELSAEGFLTTHGRLGTRVAEHPPHRWCYGLVLPDLPQADGAYGERHWNAKALAATAINQGHDRRIEIFHGLNGHPDLPEHQRLLSAIAQQRLAGLIVPSAGRIRDWFDPARVDLPVIGVEPVARRPHLGDIRLDLMDFLRRALALVQRSGARRPAVLVDPRSHHLIAGLIVTARRLGLDLPTHRVQGLPAQAPVWATHLIATLFRSDPPDALIVCDEVAIPAVEDALDAHGVGKIVQVHIANLPMPSLARRPALRLGWDHRHFLEEAMRLIDAWHSDRRPIGDQCLPLVEMD